MNNNFDGKTKCTKREPLKCLLKEFLFYKVAKTIEENFPGCAISAALSAKDCELRGKGKAILKEVFKVDNIVNQVHTCRAIIKFSLHSNQRSWKLRYN